MLQRDYIMRLLQQFFEALEDVYKRQPPAPSHNACHVWPHCSFWLYAYLLFLLLSSAALPQAMQVEGVVACLLYTSRCV